MGCPEKSVTSYTSTLLNIPEDGRYYLHCGGNFRSRHRVTSLVVSSYTLPRQYKHIHVKCQYLCSILIIVQVPTQNLIRSLQHKISQQFLQHRQRRSLRTGRHDEDSSRFSPFRESAQSRCNVIIKFSFPIVLGSYIQKAGTPKCAPSTKMFRTTANRVGNKKVFLF